jgi:hypothetical protein
VAAQDNLNERQFSVSLKTPGGSTIIRQQTATSAKEAHRKTLWDLRMEGKSTQAHQWSARVRPIES